MSVSALESPAPFALAVGERWVISKFVLSVSRYPLKMGNSLFSCLDRGLVNGIFKLA